MLIFEATGYNSYRIWIPHSQKKAVAIMEKYCLWGGYDKYNGDLLSYECNVSQVLKAAYAFERAKIPYDIKG